MLNPFSLVREEAEGEGMEEVMVEDMEAVEEALEVARGDTGEDMEEEEVVMDMESAVLIMKSQKNSWKKI